MSDDAWTAELRRRWDEGIVRYPDPAVEVLDPRFGAYRLGNAAVERLYTGARWAEGPVWFGDFRSLVFSDIPNNRMLRYCEVTDEVTLFRQPSNYSNGNTRDLQGRLITCEHLTRRVTRTEHDGSLTVLLDRFDGKRLNGPNDVVVDSDGAVWFTDPGYGILMAYEGELAEAELPTRVYRLDSVSGDATVVADDLVKPNGLCFSRTSRGYTSPTPGTRTTPMDRGTSGCSRCPTGGSCVAARFSPICPPGLPMAYGLIATATCGPASAGPHQERTACTA